MFLLLEDRADIARAQSALETTIKRAFRQITTRRIGWAGGGLENAELMTDGEYWFWSADHDVDDRIARRLNWFGRISDGRGVSIAVEINTPYQGRENRVAGFFAKSTETGRVYLFHSARVGGGGKGVKKDALVAWAGLNLSPVYGSDGDMREGILVMPVTGVGAIQPAISYVQSIIDFKAAVKTGEATSPQAKDREKELSDYFDEFFGRKQGKSQSRDIDYLSRHGEVVKELFSWRSLRGLAAGHRIVKTGMLDFGVSRKNVLTEAYEVKTSTRRADIYTGIGQLFVHGSAMSCKKILVLPADDSIAEDLRAALRRNEIELLRYRLTEKAVVIL